MRKLTLYIFLFVVTISGLTAVPPRTEADILNYIAILKQVLEYRCAKEKGFLATKKYRWNEWRLRNCAEYHNPSVIKREDIVYVSTKGDLTPEQQMKLLIKFLDVQKHFADNECCKVKFMSRYEYYLARPVADDFMVNDKKKCPVFG